VRERDGHLAIRTDWLRRGKAMKTAGRENQKRYTSVVATRDHGTESENNPAQWGGLDGKKNSGHRRSVFSLTPFMERIRSWAISGRAATEFEGIY
jgi:hypothetical protein